MLRQVSEAATECKCCAQEALLFDVRDFAKNCSEQRGVHLPLTGIPIYYYKCSSCGFIFTTQFDDLSHDEVKKLVYNEGYEKVDPDWSDARPAQQVGLIEGAFGPVKKEISVLDYGGGTGLLVERLKQAGFSDAVSYDPFYEEHGGRPERRFNLIVCFEVVEHSPDPFAVFAEMFSFLDSGRGFVLFSTLVAPPEIDQLKGSWWYIGPRNGHISIHTARSLSQVICRLGMTYGQANPNLHGAFKTVPDFAQALVTS